MTSLKMMRNSCQNMQKAIETHKNKSKNQIDIDENLIEIGDEIEKYQRSIYRNTSKSIRTYRNV